MALIAPVTSALALRKGSLRLLLLRATALVVALAPGALASRSAIRAVVGEDPRVARLPDPIPFHVVQDVVESLAGAPLGLLAAGIALFFVCDQVITAGALVVLDPNSHDPKPRVWRALFDEGAAHFWPFVRIAGAVLVVAALCLAAIGAVSDALLVRAEREGWTADARFVVLPVWRAAISSIVLAKLGALALFARVLTVVDERRRVRRTLSDAARVLFRAPLRTLVVVALTSSALTFAGAALVARAAIVDGATFGLVGGALLVVAHLFAWHFLVRYARALVDDDRFMDLRARGDAPFGVWPWFRRAVLRRA